MSGVAQDLVNAEELVHELATGWPVAVATTGVSMATGFGDAMRGGLWLQHRQVVVYEVQPSEVLAHLVAWVDDYRAGRGWA